MIFAGGKGVEELHFSKLLLKTVDYAVFGILLGKSKYSGLIQV